MRPSEISKCNRGLQQEKKKKEIDKLPSAFEYSEWSLLFFCKVWPGY